MLIINYDKHDNNINFWYLSGTFAVALILDLLFSIVAVVMFLKQLFIVIRIGMPNGIQAGINYRLSYQLQQLQLQTQNQRSKRLHIQMEPQMEHVHPAEQAQKKIDRNIPDNNIGRSSSTSSTTGPHAQGIHMDSKQKNHIKMILFASKLLALLMVSIISTHMAFLCWCLVSVHWIWYLIDATVRYIYCLWLSFAFTDRYYKKYFGGYICTRVLFPCIRTMAVGIDDIKPIKTDIDTNDISMDHNQKKHCKGMCQGKLLRLCGVCCCFGCCACLWDLNWGWLACIRDSIAGLCGIKKETTVKEFEIGKVEAGLMVRMYNRY